MSNIDGNTTSIWMNNPDASLDYSTLHIEYMAEANFDPAT